MQFAKDSFFVALRERLVGINPARTITSNGAVRPAVVAAENEPVSNPQALPDTFYLRWGGAGAAGGQQGHAGLMRMECRVSYFTKGSCESGVDRGRMLGQLGSELLNMLRPAHTAKRDYSQSPSADLGSSVFWSAPRFEPDGTAGEEVSGEASQVAVVEVYFYPEVRQ